MAITNEAAFTTALERMIDEHRRKCVDLGRQELIRHALENKEAFASRCGALATWTPSDSTGRSPKDTVIVRNPQSEKKIDWDSPNCIPLDPETFEMLWSDALEVLAGKPRLYVTNRYLGADPAYALPVKTITDRALHSVFVDNMFRARPDGAENSIFADYGFQIVALPYDKIETSRYAGRLRKTGDGTTSDMVIAMDFDRRLGLVYGSAYCGSIKKLMFTVMNFLLPEHGILPLHCSANEGRRGDTALLLGLSGTGKTSLSADPDRALLGDDEHGWGDRGVANFEGGCYAKLINLREEKEAEIYRAVFHEVDPLQHGAIVENCLMYPDGEFDVDDERLTPNSRGSYPLSFLDNIKTPPVGDHPKTILFLAADANGVLPPVARLNPNQAMLWFLMGYTSKLAGTERGVVDPVTTFSRFFGAPFMPRLPDHYAKMLGDKLAEHGTKVFLVNTGWSGGSFGEGARMDIRLTRRLVEAALNGDLDRVPYREDELFHVGIPESCPGVPSELLFPRNTWKDPRAYDARARKLAAEFSAAFDKNYGKKSIDPAVVAECPGK
ncbi:MAG TPA: phosphoenolpyruvate carboxykinase (ATP) [Candidatus Polarisedimenticolaceae bacterium]|nr:phosphoenolpyruvate carboxykinase (ATP) [Candidatus Polarisedimenticolaceae bacterium]